MNSKNSKSSKISRDFTHLRILRILRVLRRLRIRRILVQGEGGVLGRTGTRNHMHTRTGARSHTRTRGIIGPMAAWGGREEGRGVRRTISDNPARHVGETYYYPSYINIDIRVSLIVDIATMIIIIHLVGGGYVFIFNIHHNMITVIAMIVHILLLVIARRKRGCPEFKLIEHLKTLNLEVGYRNVCM